MTEHDQSHLSPQARCDILAEPVMEISLTFPSSLAVFYKVQDIDKSYSCTLCKAIEEITEKTLTDRIES